MVVIALIGILASIVFTYINPSRARARDSRRQSDIYQINLAMEMCYTDGNCGGVEKYRTFIDGPHDNDPIGSYLVLPPDPKNSGDYQYQWKDSEEQYYCVYVKLESLTNPTWLCTSNKGIAQKEAPFSCSDTTKPCGDDCCGPDIN